MRIGSKEHFEKIFNNMNIDKYGDLDIYNATQRIEQLVNEIEKLKHYHKLEIETMTQDFNLVNEELKKSRNHIEWLDDKIEDLHKHMVGKYQK